MPKSTRRTSQKKAHCPTCNTEVSSKKGELEKARVCGECGTHIKMTQVGSVTTGSVRGEIT